MLNKAKTLKGYKLNSLDGEIGKVKEFYFDDKNWKIRYLVADTGSWLIGRQVLISPHALVGVNKEEQDISINLTKNQIENSPSLKSDEPVSRQFEEDYFGYYQWPIYWGGGLSMGSIPEIYPIMESVQGEGNLKESNQREKNWDAHLRSTHNVSGYDIQANDGEIGHVEDFIIDAKTLEISYLIIDTMNWWPGKKILISPKWINHVSWNESKVFVNLPRETIKQSPEYTDVSQITSEYEDRLHKYYNQQ